MKEAKIDKAYSPEYVTHHQAKHKKHKAEKKIKEKEKKVKEKVAQEKAKAKIKTPEELAKIAKRKEYMSPAVKVPRMVEREAKERKNAFKEGVKQNEKFFAKEYEGIAPEKRKAMQYEANKIAQRQRQGAERRLLGEQSLKGIGGKSGVAFAQRKELVRSEHDARNQAHRDLDKLNSDLALKKQAAIFSGAQGEVAQRGLDKQRAVDEIRYKKDIKHEKSLAKKLGKAFRRV